MGGYDGLAMTFGITHSHMISIKFCCLLSYNVLMIMTKFQSVSPISHEPLANNIAVQHNYIHFPVIA